MFDMNGHCGGPYVVDLAGAHYSCLFYLIGSLFSFKIDAVPIPSLSIIRSISTFVNFQLLKML